MAAKAVRRYQALKDEVIHLLASRHAQGQGRVPASAMFEGLCDDPQFITRALNELAELNLIGDVRDSEGMRLTAAGQKAAEAALPPEPDAHVARPYPSAAQFDFFISYASEDRDLAESLEESLTAQGYKVWRDRSQLTFGDSLTAKISEGLATSKFAIVLLSRAFLRKNWPQAELNALQARAISVGQKVILPIRRDLTHEEMARHLPLLGDKLTIAFDGNLDEVISEIGRAVKP